MLGRVPLALALSLAVGLYAWTVSWQFAVGLGIIMFTLCVVGGLLHREWS